MAILNPTQLSAEAQVIATETTAGTNTASRIGGMFQDLVDSGVYAVKASLSSAEILALNTTPKQVVAAGGAGTVLFPVAILWKYTFGTTPYATNTTLRVRMGGTMMSLGSLLTQTGNAYALQPLLGGVFATDISNTGITIDVQTGNPTGGDGTLDAYLIYNTISL
jgi:hypothetical protein